MPFINSTSYGERSGRRSSYTMYKTLRLEVGGGAAAVDDAMIAKKSMALMHSVGIAAVVAKATRSATARDSECT